MHQPRAQKWADMFVMLSGGLELGRIAASPEHLLWKKSIRSRSMRYPGQNVSSRGAGSPRLRGGSFATRRLHRHPQSLLRRAQNLRAQPTVVPESEHGASSPMVVAQNCGKSCTALVPNSVDFLALSEHPLYHALCKI